MEDNQNYNHNEAENETENVELSEIVDKFDETLILENEEDEDEGFEFCFLGGELNSPISAEEVFEDGQIRIISPFSGENSESSATTSYGPPPVKKFYVVSNSPENDDVAEGPYCVWKSPTPEMSQKSNSTGFSKLWKVRELLSRSNSDGKDAFVFLKSDNAAEVASSNKEKEKKKKKEVKLENIEVGRKGGETTAYRGERKLKKSAYEVFYGGGKDKKKGGGNNNNKSYLPYRQDLVGFFTNGSGMSRNVHPY